MKFSQLIGKVEPMSLLDGLWILF